MTLDDGARTKFLDDITVKALIKGTIVALLFLAAQT
jgi:hypothetical protein